jgi:hypothetical protein
MKANRRFSAAQAMNSRLTRSCRTATALVATVAALVVAGRGVAHAQSAPPRGPGTYEITWFSINTVTEKPTVAKLLLVLFSTPLSDSLRAQMNPSRGKGRTAPPSGACWRITEGEAAMNARPQTATSTEWELAGTSEVNVQLWFIVDAGSALRFTVVGDSVRGEITSSGWMRGPNGRASPRVVRDSVAGRRVGGADLDRCLR